MIDNDRKKEKKMNRRRLQFLWRFARPYRSTIISGEICLMTSYILDVIKPLILAAIIDQAFYHTDRDFLFQGLLIYLILFLGDITAWLIYSFIWQRVYNKFVFDIRMKLYERVLYAKASFLGRMKTGDVQTRINEDSSELIHIIQRNLLHTFNQLFSYVLSIIMVFTINRTIALFMLVVIPLTVVLTGYLGSRARKISRESAKRHGAYISRAFEFIKGIREIHLLNAEKYAKKYILSNLIKLLRLDVKTAKIDFTIKKGNETINLIASLGLYALSAYMVFRGELTVGFFLAVSEYFFRLQRSLGWMAENYIQWQKRKAFVDRGVELMDIPCELDDERDQELEVSDGSIVFDDTYFSYEDGEPVLQGININIKSGSKVALAGASGAGKTTLAGLITSYYVPDKGRILIDGQDLSKCSYGSIRRQIGIVQQEIQLFSGTIRENLTAGKKDAQDKELWEALKKANIYDHIAGLEKQLDTVIGDVSGTGLSGGQAQRLMLARVFLKDPHILIMDEATSALDSESELKVREAFERLSRGRTTIIIAHRLSTIISCERVLVLEGSRITADGTHSRLLRESPHYRELFEEQYLSIPVMNKYGL